MIRVGLYPGTFDPVHNGHLDIIERATRLFDELVIGVAINESKGPLFSLEERLAIMEAEVPHLNAECKVTVRPIKGLTIVVAQEIGAQTVVKGLRAVNDFEYEFQMTAMNQQLSNREIETVFLMRDPMHQAIASRLVKEIAMLGGDVSKFVTPRIKERLLAKVGRG
jgi:pantetheine-phosphate adenylyltransferase